jgi:lysophospholipid acyltransferase (LPLAT)-like uncharacterized protein
VSPSDRLKTRLIAAAAYPTIAALCATLRWRVEGASVYDDIIRSGRPPIIAFWHGRILPAAWHFRRRGIVAMTSANFDGQWTARILEHLGNRTVAGSSSRRGMRALLELKREMGQGRPAAFALDGPRGPSRVAQPGAAWLSAATGNPVLLFHAEADRHWDIRSWDRTQVPKPFATVAIVMRRSTAVPAAGKSDVERASAELSRELSELESEAQALLRAPTPLPASRT